jgi:nitroreductase
MIVSEAVAKRRATRAFANRPVDTSLIVKILDQAARAPSGGNLQPWRIVVLNGEPQRRFRTDMRERLRDPAPDPADYAIYPANLGEPYRTSRFAVGEAMYERLGIGRADKPARLAWLARNYEFFGAPAGLFCFLDRAMGPPQWADLGMYLQTVMLLLTEAGLDSCPQEAWSHYNRFVSDWLGVGDELMLFCGVAIGYADDAHAVNSLVTDRVGLSQFVSVVDNENRRGRVPLCEAGDQQ